MTNAQRTRTERTVAGLARTSVCAAVAVCLAGACAARRPASLADRLVRQASAADLDRSAAATFDVPETKTVAEPGAVGPAPEIVRKSASTPTIEGTDSRLEAALTALGAQPSAQTLIAASDEYRRLHIFDKAEEQLQLALRLRGSDPGIHERLARLWRDWGFPTIALPHAARAEFYAPRSPGIQNTMATIFVALGRLDEAAARLERAIALDATAAYALNNLCYVRLMQGDRAAAESRCREALLLAPDLGSARANLALVTAAGGDRAPKE